MTAGGASVTGNNSATLTLSGTEAQINATLATLSYQGGVNFNGSDTLTVLSTDSSASTHTDTVNITVTPVNDAPTVAQCDCRPGRDEGQSSSRSRFRRTRSMTWMATRWFMARNAFER